MKTKEEIEERHKEMMADILEYMAKQKSRSRKVEAASMAKAKTALKAVFPALSPSGPFERCDFLDHSEAHSRSINVVFLQRNAYFTAFFKLYNIICTSFQILRIFRAFAHFFFQISAKFRRISLE